MADTIPSSDRGARVRVAIVSSVHRWNDTRVFVKQAISLVENGYDVTLAAIGDQGSPFEASGVRVVPLPRRRRALRWLTWLSILRIILSQRAKIVHAHDPELIPLVLLLKLIGRFAICDIHENVAEQVLHKEWIPRLCRVPLSRLLKGVQRSLPRLADAVILAEDLDRTRLSGAGQCVGDSELSAAAALVEAGLSLRNVQADLCGRCPWRPRYSPVRRADASARRARGSRAVVHCRQLRRSRRRAANAGARARAWPRTARRLRWTTPSRGHSRADTAGRRRARVVASDRELPRIVPTKMFEYMAAGIPVIASNFVLWADVLVPNECGKVVDPLNVEEATAAVDRGLDAAGPSRASRAKRACGCRATVPLGRRVTASDRRLCRAGSPRERLRSPGIGVNDDLGSSVVDVISTSSDHPAKEGYALEQGAFLRE